MIRVLFIFLSILYVIPSIAQNYSITTTLSCSGIRLDEKRSFDLLINTETGEMWQFPGFVALGCTGEDKNRKINFSIDENTLQMNCDNGWGYVSRLVLSRNSGNLNVNTTVLNKKTGNSRFENSTYSCNKVTQKLF